ncbi:MAG: EpsG family protein [Rhizobium sp.]|nr:EpsG family protein [Rhizobium sp.]
MYLYIGIYAALAFAAFFLRSRRASWQAAVAVGGFLVLFMGGRREVGCDYLTYESRFATLYPPGYGWLDALGDTEGGFQWVNVLARDLGWGFNGVIMLCAAVYGAALVRFSRLAPRPLALIAIAFPILVLQLGMSGMRQAMATAFLMLAYAAFSERRQWVTAAWVGVAYLFHESAIALLPIAFLARRQISPKYLVLGVLLLAPVAGWLLGDRFEVYSARYIEQVYGENASGGAWFRYAAAVLPFLLFFWKRRRVQAAFPGLYPLFWLFMVLTFALVLVGAVSSVALHRLTFYVLPVSLLAFLCVVESIFAPGSRRLARALPFAIYGLYILSWFLLSRHGTSCYIPYQSWLL